MRSRLHRSPTRSSAAARGVWAARQGDRRASALTTAVEGVTCALQVTSYPAEATNRTMTALADLGREIGEIAERVGPSVVGIGNRWRGGSGVVIGENRILTNAHNLHGDEVTVTFADGRSADATVVGVDADGDLAVLEASTEGAPTLAFAEGEAPGIGGAVVALGNPNGHGPRVTFGFVSGTGRSFRGPRGRRVAGAVEHTAPLMPGIVRRTGRRPRGAAARHQHQPARQRLLSRDRGRCGVARQGHGTRPWRVADATSARRRPGAIARRPPAASRGRPAGA